jgi:hypothetical protein
VFVLRQKHKNRVREDVRQERRDGLLLVFDQVRKELQTWKESQENEMDRQEINRNRKQIDNKILLE